MGTVQESPAGRITIGDVVVAEVVGLTMLECYGVVTVHFHDVRRGAP